MKCGFWATNLVEEDETLTYEDLIFFYYGFSIPCGIIKEKPVNNFGGVFLLQKTFYKLFMKTLKFIYV